jgi:hypothetical protein
MPSNTNNPTFNRFSNYGPSIGYHTRTLFVYSGETGGNTNLYGVSDMLDSKDGIQYLINNFSGSCHGYHHFPGGYWRRGKSVRLKGNCLVMGFPEEEAGQYTVFGMSVGLLSVSGSAPYPNTPLAQSATTNKFPLTDGNDPPELCPVDFEIIITCAQEEDGFSPEGSRWFASGYYKYNYGNDDFINGGNNTTNCYIPIVYNDAGQKNIYYGLSKADYIDKETIIMFNFYDSTVYYLYLTSLILEELA